MTVAASMTSQLLVSREDLSKSTNVHDWLSTQPDECTYGLSALWLRAVGCCPVTLHFTRQHKSETILVYNTVSVTSESDNSTHSYSSVW